MNRNSQRGVALVITLIMLAMVTVMAVLFLGISRRERSSVTVSASLIDAKNAADSGQARALSEIIARITAQSNLFAYDFLVSTNFINPNGFRPGLTSLTNVSYVYAGNGQPLNRDADIRQNQVNLFYDPRPPVFVVTNLTNGASEFRFYLDLNRNGRFDTNGPQFVFNTNGVRVGFTNLVGDPEWIGIPEHPDWPHSPSNRFIARTAFVVVPAGKTLDINYIHNNARNLIPGPTPQIGYVRNQGVGPWEINLAAFLRDLNTNVWNAPGSYTYNPPVAKQQLGGVGGFAFSDALSILTNRYVRNGPNWMSPVSVNRAFGGRADNFIRRDQINEYSDGPIMTGTSLPTETGNVTSSDDPTKLWSGANNTNGFSSIQELFDPTKTSVAFTNRLRKALAGPGTYNQNTFYDQSLLAGCSSFVATGGEHHRRGHEPLPVVPGHQHELLRAISVPSSFPVGWNKRRDQWLPGSDQHQSGPVIDQQMG